jgi:hypothetical protein
MSASEGAEGELFSGFAGGSDQAEKMENPG